MQNCKVQFSQFNLLYKKDSCGGWRIIPLIFLDVKTLGQSFFWVDEQSIQMSIRILNFIECPPLGQVIKLILTGFVVVQENIKPSVLMQRPRKFGLYF